MTHDNLVRTADELGLAHSQVQAVARFFEAGATIPFIARYRKEATGSLDEVRIAQVQEKLAKLAQLSERKKAILDALAERGALTPDLEKNLAAAPTLTRLEDLYLPHRPKRRTRGTMAREKGLSPLAERLFRQRGEDPEMAAAAFVKGEVSSLHDALAGARDIMAEMIAVDEKARKRLRILFSKESRIVASVVAGKESEGAKFRDYFALDEPLAKAPSHRILAIFRGEREGFLRVKFAPPPERAEAALQSIFVRGTGKDAQMVKEAVRDACRRLLLKSMETEIRGQVRERADHTAIGVFADNLRQLLLAAPLGAKRVMGVDPGFASGCKLACLDRQGKLLAHDTVFPHGGEGGRKKAEEKVAALAKKHAIEAIGVGNGTAGRETQRFIEGIETLSGIPVIPVDERGASVYSASEIARQEFADHDLTVRGTVSIGRRLMDPLSELVKIDPKAIGVGQYQHDVDQRKLASALNAVVESSVNGVGVDLNRASRELLLRVSGLGPSLADNIVAHRNDRGPFLNRKALLKVPRLGPKAFEQAAGFLRITGGDNPLDASAVHPESYFVVDAMAKDLGCTAADLMKNETLRDQIRVEAYATAKTGLPTLRDIMAELARPGRDPREDFTPFSFTEGIEKPEDLREGMTLSGIVTNVTAFGAFVDIGVHRDGLVHISELSDRFVRDPAEVVRVNQQVTVTVLEVDQARKRIGLSMKRR